MPIPLLALESCIRYGEIVNFCYLQRIYFHDWSLSQVILLPFFSSCCILLWLWLCFPRSFQILLFVSFCLYFDRCHLKLPRIPTTTLMLHPQSHLFLRPKDSWYCWGLREVTRMKWFNYGGRRGGIRGYSPYILCVDRRCFMSNGARRCPTKWGASELRRQGWLSRRRMSRQMSGQRPFLDNLMTLTTVNSSFSSGPCLCGLIHLMFLAAFLYFWSFLCFSVLSIDMYYCEMCWFSFWAGRT